MDFFWLSVWMAQRGKEGDLIQYYCQFHLRKFRPTNLSNTTGKTGLNKFEERKKKSCFSKNFNPKLNFESRIKERVSRHANMME